jgi:hypothetical protein
MKAFRLPVQLQEFVVGGPSAFPNAVLVWPAAKRSKISWTVADLGALNEIRNRKRHRRDVFTVERYRVVRRYEP